MNEIVTEVEDFEIDKVADACRDTSVVLQPPTIDIVVAQLFEVHIFVAPIVLPAPLLAIGFVVKCDEGIALLYTVYEDGQRDKRF